ncbi:MULTISPECIES: ATP-binding protein [unclassified Streptomyces]|uniref:ATP-binding protein n=1 Tax=unclassified Streptomyces TaxID=2593676 RepID=UPI000D1E0036|nr:ATP-binding protein [Streptomyces sp. Ru87]
MTESPARAGAASRQPALRRDVLDYALTPRSVTLARRRAVGLVEEWGHPGIAGDVAVLLSELATNALLHGHVPGRLFRVELALTRTVLRIAVSDARGETLPCPRTAPPEEHTGRGLLIVETLAARWGVERRTVGKTVWCELDLPGRGASGPRGHGQPGPGTPGPYRAVCEPAPRPERHGKRSRAWPIT